MAEKWHQGGEENVNYPMIYLYDIGILGNLIQYNAHASVVSYSMDGIITETVMLNEDFEIIQELDLGIDEYE
jgi:hypothetical protein